MKQPKKTCKFWTEEKVAFEARKYDCKGDFLKGSAGAYHFAHRKKILDKVCAHMPQKYEIWDINKVNEEAEKYNNWADFRTKSPRAYDYAKRNGLLEYICSQIDGIGSEQKGRKKEPIKLMTKFEHATLRDANEARIINGLKPLEVKIRTCIVCKKKFESIGDRTCGCIKDRVTTLFGVEVV